MKRGGVFFLLPSSNELPNIKGRTSLSWNNPKFGLIMFVLDSTFTDQPAFRSVISDIQNIAKQAVCFSEDLVYVPGRTNLMRLPASLAHPSINELDKIVHENEVLVRAMISFGLCACANGRTARSSVWVG
jgi:hypothetical protein